MTSSRIIRRRFAEILLIVGLAASGAAQPALAQTAKRLRAAHARPTSARSLEIDGVVKTLYGAPVAGVQVQIAMPSHPDPVSTVNTNQKGSFQTHLQVPGTRDPAIEISVAESDDGYSAAQATVDPQAGGDRVAVELVVRPSQAHEDPYQLPFDALLASLAPRLSPAAPVGRSRGSEPAGYRQAATEFLTDHQTAEALPGLRRAVQADPNCVQCQTALGLALIDEGDLSGSLGRLEHAATLAYPPQAEHRMPEPFLILGILQDWQGDPGKAEIFFLQALEINASDPLAIQELGRSCLLRKDWEAADHYLAQAISAGAGGSAHLLRAQALLALGKPEDADRELTAFVGGRKPKKLAEPFRNAWAEIKDHVQAESEGNAGKTYIAQPVPQLIQEVPELEGLQPAASQAQLGAILQGVGRAQQDFFHSFANVSADEQVTAEILGRKGKVEAHDTDRFRYLFLAAVSDPIRGLSEYRTDGTGQSAVTSKPGRGYMLTQGFASSSVYFLPAYQADSVFRYLGLQDLNGRSTWVVAFAQNPGLAHMMGAFIAKDSSYPTPLQGLAWIDSTTYQIVRMRTDLLKPVEPIRLTRETTDIQYAPIHLAGAGPPVWMPRHVTVTVKWAKGYLRNEHDYTGYRLFQVTTHEKQKLDKLRHRAAKKSG